MVQELRAIPEGDRVIIGGDLNDHVGISREAIERIHGGWGVGEKNEEGERVTYFAMAFDLSIVNTLSAKDGDLRLSASNACLPKTEINVFVTECVFFTSTCYKLHMYVHIA